MSIGYLRRLIDLDDKFPGVSDTEFDVRLELRFDPEDNEFKALFLQDPFVVETREAVSEDFFYDHDRCNRYLFPGQGMCYIIPFWSKERLDQFIGGDPDSCGPLGMVINDIPTTMLFMARDSLILSSEKENRCPRLGMGFVLDSLRLLDTAVKRVHERQADLCVLP